jgi:hypothetical protein
MYLVMFMPLLLNGAGKLSLDHWLARRFIVRCACSTHPERRAKKTARTSRG